MLTFQLLSWKNGIQGKPLRPFQLDELQSHRRRRLFSRRILRFPAKTLKSQANH